MGNAAADQSSTSGPEDLKILYRAFDTAWNVVKSHYAADPQSIEVGRLRQMPCWPHTETVLRMPMPSAREQSTGCAIGRCWSSQVAVAPSQLKLRQTNRREAGRPEA